MGFRIFADALASNASRERGLIPCYPLCVTMLKAEMPWVNNRALHARGISTSPFRSLQSKSKGQAVPSPRCLRRSRRLNRKPVARTYFPDWRHFIALGPWTMLSPQSHPDALGEVKSCLHSGAWSHSEWLYWGGGVPTLPRRGVGLTCRAHKPRTKVTRDDGAQRKAYMPWTPKACRAPEALP